MSPTSKDNSGMDELMGITAMAEAAVALHEVYTSLLAAGFDEFAALWLVGVAMKGLPMPDWLLARLQDDE